MTTMVDTNITNSTAFNVKQSARAFQILSDNIYSNKIQTVIRELGTNALDSHSQAGIPETPFKVHVPTVFEPWFSVIDSGVGMSEEFVNELYVTYFGSTKSADLTAIGELGLGSKSPYCYTQQFSIISAYQGQKTTYVAYVGEDWTPQLSIMHRESTSESNGVEVKVPVSQTDIGEFNRILLQVYGWFDVTPTIINADTEIKKHTLKSTNDERVWVYPAGNGCRSHNGAHVLMGQVLYPIDLAAIGDITVKDNDNVINLASYLNAPYVFKYNIGEVDFHASREQLTYTQRTVSAIKSTVISFYKRTKKELLHEMSQFDCDWDRAKYANKLLTSNAHTQYYPILESGRLGKYIIPRWFYIDDADQSFSYQYRNRKLQRSALHMVHPNHDVAFVVVETLNAKSRKKIRALFETKKYSSIIVLDSKEADSILKQMGNPKTIDLEEYVVDTAVKKRTHSYNSVVHLDRDCKWKPGPSTSGTKYYVVLNGYGPVDFPDFDLKKLQQYLNRSYSNMFANVQINGVRKSYLSEIEGDSSWVPLLGYIQDKLALFVKDRYIDVKNYSINQHLPKQLARDILAQLPEDHVLSKFIRRRLNTVSISYSDKELYNTFMPELYKEKSKDMSYVLSDYPLLNALDFRKCTSDSVIQYIQLVDSQES